MTTTLLAEGFVGSTAWYIILGVVVVALIVFYVQYRKKMQ